MPPGIDTLTAAPLVAEIGGRSLRIAPLTLADLGLLQAWVNAKLLAGLPDPIAIARRLVEGMPLEIQAKLLMEAYHDARDAREAAPTAPLGSPEARAIVGTPEGIRQVLVLALRRHHPELTPDDVMDLMGSLLPGDLDHLIAHAFGTRGAPDPSPKAPGAETDGARPMAGPTSTNGSAGSRSASTPIPSVA